MQIILIILLAGFLASCSSLSQPPCATTSQLRADCPPAGAIDDASINKLYNSRTWLPPSRQTIDPVKFGEQAKIPINGARAKILGVTEDAALDSLAAKIWMIEHARHTIDAAYFIFSRDMVGYAVLGALCDAVKRGIDVRLMVDSLGSMHPTHSELRALETCAEQAGFMHNTSGQVTTRRARVQVVLFNAMSKLHINRRSHDKLLIIDGRFTEQAMVMTGGRNISLDYYGLNEDGSKDPSAFRDLEILIRSGSKNTSETKTVGDISSGYYTLLFLHRGNRRLYPVEDDDDSTLSRDTYLRQRQISQKMLAFLKKVPLIEQRLSNMPHFMNQDFHQVNVRLSHQLSNLVNPDVVTNTRELVKSNPNSILHLIQQYLEEELKTGNISKSTRIVSPYIFVGQYYDEEGNLVYDGAVETNKLLREHPNIILEVITNSPLTSDNRMTQAIIDMNMVPRMLLPDSLRKAWLTSLKKGEFNPEVTNSEEWRKHVDSSQIFIYETGKLDSVLLGKGEKHYGKLHAKFIVTDNGGFIGTSNFDYRSNLYNNEMGFFFEGNSLRDDLIRQFDILKQTSYRWGSPQWLKLRRMMIETRSKKSGAVRYQRTLYKLIRALELQYLM